MTNISPEIASVLRWSPAEWTELFTTELKQPLPGEKIQREWSPRQSYGRHFGPVAGNVREAAILILLYPQIKQSSQESFWCIAFTLRPQTISHAGQVCLPGGRKEGNETPTETALREAEEELNIQAEQLQLCGLLSPVHVYNSNHTITPLLGVAEATPEFILQQSEVEQLIEVPLLEFFQKPALITKQIKTGRLSVSGTCASGTGY